MSKKILFLFVISICTLNANSQQEQKEKSLDIYGSVMTDIGYNIDQIDPDWYDVVRTTKLPTYKNQYGPNGNVYFSVRQTIFGVKGYTKTSKGELKTQLEFGLFGTGADAGQTTIRLRHAYAELGKFGVGQTNSPFMDADMYPNIVEGWGPPGMVFFRNVQIRYMPIQGDSKLTIALERPGASADQGSYAERIELSNVKGKFSLPDLSAEYRYGKEWGYIELAGILRRIEWVDMGNINIDLSGSATGWGFNLSTNLKIFKNDIFRGQFVYGEGIENYMNDAPADIGIKNNFGNPSKPVIGVALPVTGVVAFLDHKWNEKLSTSIGYSSVKIDNAEASVARAFKKGQYAIVNLLYSPTSYLLSAVEFQYGKRENFKDGFTSSINKIQFSFKYNFGHIFYRE